jgi:hypothetical protein
MEKRRGKALKKEVRAGEINAKTKTNNNKK